MMWFGDPQKYHRQQIQPALNLEAWMGPWSHLDMKQPFVSRSIFRNSSSKAATEAVKKLQMELGVSAGGSRDKNPWMIFFSISKA